MKIPIKKDDKIKELRKNMEVVEIHLEHMERLSHFFHPFFPFTAKKIDDLTIDSIDKSVALIHRFNHVQDTLASKIFPDFLDVTREESKGPTFIDKLNLLETLQIIDSAYQWIDLRDLRNNLSHEYVNFPEAQADLLNKVNASIPIFITTFGRLKQQMKDLGLLG